MPVRGHRKLLRNLGVLLLATQLVAFINPRTDDMADLRKLAEQYKDIPVQTPTVRSNKPTPTSSTSETSDLKTIAQQALSTRESPDLINAIESINIAHRVIVTAPRSCAECDIAGVAGRELTIRAPKSRQMAPQCSMLMNSKGQLGSGGRSLFAIMSEEKYVRAYTEPNALGSYCPNFNNLSKTEKLQAWTWFWTALAQEEASCNSTKHHGRTGVKNGKTIILNPTEGYGLWALERDRNMRLARGKACSLIGSVEGQARCSIDIMMKTKLAKGASASKASGYWGPVIRESRDHQIMPHMRRFSLCF